MSRTTTALKRLAVPGLAALTMIAGIPVLASTAASAAPGDTIVMTPETDSASTGTCNVFTVQVRNSAGNPATSTVDVTITERDTSTTETADATFCTTQAEGSGNDTSAGFTPTTGTPPSSSQGITTGDTDRAEFTPNSEGVVTFGVASNAPQVLDIRAFLEEDDNDVFNDGETSDTSVKTFTQGGQDAVTVVDAEPETQTEFTGTAAQFTATARNAQGDTVAGVDVDATIISGPNSAQPVACGATNNNGIATCSYTGTSAGTDTVRVFVDESGRRADTFDTGEPFDDITVTYTAAPTGLDIQLFCGNAVGSSFEECVNDPSEPSATFTATVRNSSGVVQPNVLVRFAITSDTGLNDGKIDATVTPAEARTDANGQVVVTVTDPTPTDGETIVVTATVAGQQPTESDTATLRYNEATPAEARFVDLTPEAGNLVAGSEVTAVVTDRFGNPVTGVTVTFTEVGDGNFNGTSSAQAITNAQGRASATLSGAVGATSTVTATISSAACDDAAEAASSTGPAVAAGNCTDTEQYTLTTATSPSPSAPATTPPSPSPSQTPPGQVDCSVTPTVTLEFGTINATGSSGVTVNAPANSEIQLLAYSQPSTTYRVVRRATINNTGDPAQFRIVPPTNTRLYAQIVGCDTDEVRFSKVLNVRTTLSLNVTRLGKQTYRFFGDSLPARPGGLIVSLYRVTNDGRQILTAQTRADSRNGEWVINRRFTGTGRFGFVVRTGQDLQNAPGSSNVRSLLIF
jgi:5-hydroxyisourate hydrolase-like protein (transthyretin family)